MDNFETGYGSEYDSLKLYPDESPVITLLKGMLGAIVGAIPGMLLWIILGKFGFIATVCGLVLTAGIVFGCDKMTEKGELSFVIKAVICLIVMAAAVFFAEKIVWTWALAEEFKNFAPTFKSELISYIHTNYPEFSLSDIQSVVTDEYAENALMEEYGFTEGTFSDCFSNFGRLLEALGVKGRFMVSLGKSYLFAIVGGGMAFIKSIAQNSQKI